MFHKLIAIASGMLLAATIFVPLSWANEWNKSTVMTFNEPVEVPGRVLSAGTYVFKLADSQSDREIVQIFNRDQNKIFATILAIPDYRTNTAGKTIVRFEERPHDSPQAIEAWFYPGDKYGMEFVYPKTRAMELAKANNRPVLSHQASAEAKSAELKTTPVRGVNAAGNEVEMATVVKPPTAKPPANEPTEMAAAKMPHTASDLPLLLMFGLLLIGAGLMLPRVARLGK